MPSSLLVAGLDVRSLLLEAPVLQRDRHLVQERTYARDVLREIVSTGARLVVLGTELPDLSLPDAVRRIRNSPATREVSSTTRSRGRVAWSFAGASTTMRASIFSPRPSRFAFRVRSARAGSGSRTRAARCAPDTTSATSW